MFSTPWWERKKMDETEKSTALKKAYADIILNTAKEAAARVMASERRPQAVQHELKETKEETLRLLLRIKQMMDSKISEAKTRSQIQQSRIEELEAQLQEAEDIVGNLRTELSEAQSELVRIVNNQQSAIRENNLVDRAVHLEEAELQENDATNSALMACSLQAEEAAPQENGARNSEFTACSLQATEAQVVTTLEDEIMALNTAIDANSQVGLHSSDHCYVGSTEPNLYKNGCTQRIRASERNSLNGHLSLSGKLKLVKEDKEDKKICLMAVPGTEIGCAVDKNLAEATGVGKAVTNGFKVKSCGNGKLNRNGCITPCTLKTAIVPTEETHRCADLSGYRSSPAVSAAKSLGTSHVEETTKANSISVIGIECDAHVMSKSVPVTRNDADNDSVIDEDMEMINSLVMFGQESGSGNAMRVLSVQAELDERNGVIADSNAKVSGVSGQDTDDRLLKYTFQRKRKKASMNGDNDDARVEGSTLTRRTGKKHITNSEETK